MKFYVVADEDFGRDINAKRSIFAYKNESEVPEVIRKYGTELTEAQYRTLFREAYNADPTNFLHILQG